MDDGTALVLVKLAHTLVWAFFVGCIVGIPVAARAGRLRLAAVLSVCVLLEVAILAANAMRCPLTDVAARYTTARNDAFDIYLPEWLARHNKQIFGPLWLLCEIYFAWCWARTRALRRPAA